MGAHPTRAVSGRGEKLVGPELAPREKQAKTTVKKGKTKQSEDNHDRL